MSDLDTCRMGDRCRTRTPNPDGTTTPGPADGRGLCWPDELHGRLAIEQLPHDWARLTIAARKTVGTSGVPTFGGTKAEPPIPILGEPDAIARNIAWLLDVWAAAVWERLPVAELGRRRDFAETGVRPGFAVARSAGILVRWYPALRSLGPTTFMPYGGDNHLEPAEDDGPGAIVALADLHHRARSFLGEVKRYERRDLPCPPAPHGCGLDGTLAREIGDVKVECRNCGWWCTDEEYNAYAITFQPPKLGRCPDCNVLPGVEHTAGCDVARCLEHGRQRLGCDEGHQCREALERLVVAGYATEGPGGRIEYQHRASLCTFCDCQPHDCGRDVWTGIWPGVSEAQQYGVDLNTLLVRGTWDRPSGRWYLDEP